MLRRPRPMKKYTLRLYEGDAEALEKFYPDTGYNAVIRELVHKFTKKLEAKFNATVSERSTHDDITFTDDDLKELR